MLSSKVYALLALGALCIGFTIGQAIDKQILETEVDGKHVVVPFFEEGVNTVSDEQKKVDLNAWFGIRQVLLDSMNDIVVKRKPIFKLLSYTKVLTTVLSEKKAATAQLVKDGKALKKSKGNTKDSMSIYYDMKKYAKEQAGQEKGGEKKDKDAKDAAAKEFMEKFTSFLNVFEQTMKLSPVGSYLQWSKLTIDGVPVSHEAAYFYNYFKNNGFSGTLTIADQAISILDKIGGL